LSSFSRNIVFFVVKTITDEAEFLMAGDGKSLVEKTKKWKNFGLPNTVEDKLLNC
jgi:hypothetical protein